MMTIGTLTRLAAVVCSVGLMVGIVDRAAAQGQPPAARSNEADDRAIRQSAEAFIRAFNAADAKAVAALWTPDGEYIAEDGTVVKTRPGIEKEYAAFFKSHPKARIQVVIESVRFVSPDVALEEGTTRLIQPPLGATSSGRYNTVHVRQGGKWLMASVRDVDSALLTNFELLKELEHTIGDWVLRDGDVRVETHVEWMENRNFLRRTFRVLHKDEEVSSGSQMIGIDPANGSLTSWEFDSDGGLARGVWSKEGDRWVIRVSGMTRDGVPSTATNILTFLNKDNYTWRSTSRSLAGEPLRDLPEVKVTRKK